MEIKTGYKKTEIGVIPEDWEVKKLGEFITIKGGFAFTSNYFSDKGPILITPGNFKLDGGLYFNQKNTKRYSGTYSSNMTFKSGDLLVVMTDLTPDCNLLGKPGFVFTKETFLHNQRIGKILIHKNITSKYLYWLMLSPLYLSQIKDKATGSTVRHTSNGSIYSSTIPLPTLPEQKAIAEVLSETDNLLQSLEKLIAKKRLIKQGAMQKLLTPKGDWKVKKLGEICSPSKKRINPINCQLNYKCVELEHISQETGRLIGYTYSKDLKSQKSLFFKNDVLFGKLRPYLKKFLFAEFNGVCTTEIWVLKKTINVKNKWLYYLVQSNKIIEIANQSTGTKMPRAEWKVVGDADVPLPPLPEQTRIATILTGMDAEIEALDKKLTKYKQLKQGLMQNLLTGKIRLI